MHLWAADSMILLPLAFRSHDVRQAFGLIGRVQKSSDDPKEIEAR